jgi:hypothetical protein
MFLDSFVLVFVGAIVVTVIAVWLKRKTLLSRFESSYLARPICRKIVGSLLAACAGCIAGAFAMVLAFDGTWRDPRWFVLWFFSIGVFVMPVWLLLLAPLYIFIPRTSVLWHPGLCTMLSAFSGLAIMIVFTAFKPPIGGPVWLLWIVGALVGAVTGYYGAATADTFLSPGCTGKGGVKGKE